MDSINTKGYVLEGEKAKYFEYPKQVKFWDFEGNHYIGGIAYHDEVICGCCGGIFELEDIYEFCPEDTIPLIIYDNWVEIGKEIVGEEY